jgi:hypothetical protein
LFRKIWYTLIGKQILLKAKGPMRELSVTAIAAQIEGVAPTILATRPVGEQFFGLLKPRLAEIPEGVVIVDFVGVEIMDGSFLDEVFGTLAAHHTQSVPPNRCLLLRGLTETGIDNLHITLCSRPEREEEQKKIKIHNCVLPVETPTGQIELIGPIQGHVQETVELLRAQRELTARQLAGLLDLDIHAASTRLKVPYDLGLALREEELEPHGKQYRYRWPF